MQKTFKIIDSKTFGDMQALWIEDNGKVAFTMIPAEMEDQIPDHQPDRNYQASVQGIKKALKCNFNAWQICNAIQFKVSGDGYRGGFAPGETMLGSESISHLEKYELTDIPDGKQLVMTDNRGLRFTQTCRYKVGDRFIRLQTTVKNTGNEALDLEYMPSFTLGMLSIFQPDEGTECYDLIRWRSNWSNEGRVDQKPIEELGLEVSWTGGTIRSIRFGEQGSMPVKGFFPQVGFLDKKYNVVWGAALDVLSSWQIDVVRQTDFFALAGGLVDREFGQWIKTLKPGEELSTPEAALTCAKGDIETLQNRLSTYSIGDVPASEDDLPVMFNDWCTSWGFPYPVTLNPIADKLAGRNIRYFMLDAGWFKNRDDANWSNGLGDWNVSPLYEPEGFAHFMQSLRQKGFIPGVWFEFENVMPTSNIYKNLPQLTLHLDGKIIHSGERSFLDFRKPEVIDYLTRKVIHFLRDNNVGYMKVDYNAPTGFGCDGAESKAEGLRQQTLAVQSFYKKIHEELPDLVLEICASGGHRLTHAWLRQASMGSFSDAHEGVEIPIIAANTANLIPARKNQIWAVLHAEDSEARLFYSLSAGFLGRLCLSGDIAKLSDAQFGIIDRAIATYRKAVPVLKNGDNHLVRHIGLSYAKPAGWQAFVRTNENLKLVVVHTFGSSPDKVSIPLDGEWKLLDSFKQEKVRMNIGKTLELEGLSEFNGMIFLFEK